MIRRLRRKFVLIVMAVVTLILLAIFFTMLLTARQNNERMSLGILRQALNGRLFPGNVAPPFTEGKRFPAETPGANARAPVLIVEVDESGNATAVSNQLHFIGEEDIAPVAALALQSAEDMGVLQQYALRYLREDGQTVTRIAFVDISLEQEILRTQIANSLFIGGPSLFAFFLLSIILARWAVRPVEAAWEQQKQFVANASHELKTPLTVILSNADMLRAHNAFENGQNARRMEHIHAEALRMKQLVEDMLTLAESDSGEHAAAHTAVDFSYLVTSAVLTHEPVIYDEGKTLSYEIEGGLSVRGDPHKLQQIAHILLDNARKYSAPGGAIRVGLAKSEHKNALLTVSNPGSPLPKNELEQIFLRFYRRDEARSAHGSFGLGLSIAQGIVREHKGRIWAESAGEENRFYVSLPVVQ